MRAPAPRVRFPLLALLFALLSGSAGTAAAAPVTVFFTEATGMGVAEADALSISAAFSVPIVSPSFVGDPTGTLSVVDRALDLDSVSPSPPIAPTGNRATSVWTVQNQSSFDLLGSTYLLFATTDVAVVGGQSVGYDDANVGLVIDPDSGWVFVRATDSGSGQDFYYPAVLLGSLAPGQLAATFAMNYWVDEPIQSTSTGTYVLPQMRLGMGFTPIPEPAPVLLVGFGIAWLAARRRRP